VALHVLVALTLRRDEWMNSDSLGFSVDTKPSTIRRIVSALIRAGLVTSRAGVTGGAQLAVGPESITLLDVYRALKMEPRVGVHRPNAKCPLGAIVGAPIQDVLDETEGAVAAVLASKTIAELSDVALRRITAKRKR
jgi:Rrf2 family protein